MDYFFNKEEFRRNSILYNNTRLYHAETVAHYFGKDLKFVKKRISRDERLFYRGQMYLADKSVFTIVMNAKNHHEAKQIQKHVYEEILPSIGGIGTIFSLFFPNVEFVNVS